MDKFNPAHAARLLSPERRRWLDPESILDAIGLGPGMSVADVGAGSGFITVPAAARVGVGGKVYAIDVQPGMLEMLREQVAAAGHSNVDTLLSEEARLPLPDAIVDRAIIMNVLHESEERIAILKEIARVLRPGGLVGVVEWRKEVSQMGPPQADRLSSEEIDSALRAAGFDRLEPFPAGPYHYGVKGNIGQAD